MLSIILDFILLFWQATGRCRKKYYSNALRYINVHERDRFTFSKSSRKRPRHLFYSSQLTYQPFCKRFKLQFFNTRLCQHSQMQRYLLYVIVDFKSYKRVRETACTFFTMIIHVVCHVRKVQAVYAPFCTAHNQS